MLVMCILLLCYVTACLLFIANINYTKAYFILFMLQYLPSSYIYFLHFCITYRYHKTLMHFANLVFEINMINMHSDGSVIIFSCFAHSVAWSPWLPHVLTYKYMVWK